MANAQLQEELARRSGKAQLEAEYLRRQKTEDIKAAHAKRNEPVTTTLAAEIGLLQGATFGFQDEISATVRALVHREEGEDFTTAYYRHREEIRGEMDRAREQHPIATTAGEVTGAIAGLGGMVASKVIGTGAKIGGQIARGVGVGAAEGAAYGAGTAENMQDVPGEAATGAMIGGTIGGGVPAALAGLRAGGRAITATVRPSVAADARVAAALEADGVSLNELNRRAKEAQRMGKPATLADMGGENIRRELEAIAQSPGPQAELIDKAMEARNKQQLQRISKDLVRATGQDAEDVIDVINATKEARREAAAPLYDKAMQYPIEQSDTVVKMYDDLMGSRLGKRVAGKARDLLDDFDNAPLMDRIDAVKKAIDDHIGKAKRAGESNIVAMATRRKNELLAEVDRANPAYRQAREVWGTEEGYLNALDAGRGILKPGNTSSAVQHSWQDLSNYEREAYRTGVLDAIITRMRQNPAKEPNLLNVIRSPEIRDKLAVVMEPRDFKKLEKALNIEEKMFETGAAVRKGSPTARRARMMEEQEAHVRHLNSIEMLLNLTTAPLRATFMRAIPALTRYARMQLLQKQNAIIGRRLMSSDPGMATPQTAAGARHTVRGVTSGPSGAMAIPGTVSAVEQ